MRFSRESIHGASTCLDILDNPAFGTWTEAEIDDIKVELREMIKERSHGVDAAAFAEHMVAILKNAKSTGIRPSETQILESIQRKLLSESALPF
ncbi:hypothetical protein AB4383_03045 [Vibrio breoganii]|uniref:hypothetical protein n=1 Tax=Vibrio breoganii TaxID=553239 RepID=UPI0003012C78|nr:hypothetical protein [Vibrio breoganii]OEF88127.1 hypothetical protein B003_00760 [Vibrio breoganii 1C10]PML42059.1 hypothetical protein BCT78_03280 [Vibrio breoganii]